MNSSRRLRARAAIAVAVGMLSACAGPVTMSSKHGVATRSNQMTQAVNPDAGKMPSPPLALDGQKAEQVIKAYRDNKGEAEPVRLITNVVQ